MNQSLQTAAENFSIDFTENFSNVLHRCSMKRALSKNHSQASFLSLLSDKNEATRKQEKLGRVKIASKRRSRSRSGSGNQILGKSFCLIARWRQVRDGSDAAVAVVVAANVVVVVNAVVGCFCCNCCCCSWWRCSCCYCTCNSCCFSSCYCSLEDICVMA